MAEPIHLHKPGELPVTTHSPSQAQAMQAAGWRVVSAEHAEQLRQFDAGAKRLAAEEAAKNATVAFLEPDPTAVEDDGKNDTVTLLPSLPPLDEVWANQVAETGAKLYEVMTSIQPAEAETDGPTTASADDGGDNRRRSSKPSKPAK